MKNIRPIRRLMQTLPAVLLSAAVLLSHHSAMAEEAKIAGLSYRQTKEQYNYLGSYHRGLALVRTNTNVASFVDKSGKTVFTFPDNVKALTSMYINNSESIDLFLDHGFLLITDGKGKGLADKSGKIIIPISNWIGFKFLSNGKTILAHDVSPNPWTGGGRGVGDGALYDYQGNILFEGTMDFPDTTNPADTDGMIMFSKNFNPNGWADRRYGFISSVDGKVIIPAKYHEADHFSEGLARVSDPSNKDYYGYIDKTGAVVIPFDYSGWYNDKGEEYFHNGIALVFQGHDKFYINKQGKRVEKSQAKSNSGKSKKKKK